VRSVSKTDNRIKYVASLEDYAARILDEYSSPRITFDVEMINGRIGTKDARDILLATKYEIIDEPQGLDETVTVTGITYNLSDPLDVTFDIENRRKDVADMLGTLYGQINEPPIDVLDPNKIRPIVEEIFEDLVLNPTEPWNEDLIEIIEEVLGKTNNAMKLAKLISLNADGVHMSVYFWDTEAVAWEETPTTIRRPYEMMETWWNDETITTTDGRTIAYSLPAGFDMDYQRQAVTTVGEVETTRTEEIQPPYGVDEPLFVRRDGIGGWVDMNIAGRCYMPVSLTEEEVEGIVEDVVDEISGGLPDPTDGGETTATAHIPLMYKAKVVSLNADGDQITVYLYDYSEAGWKSTTSSIYKPQFLQYSEWIGTVTYTDGAEITYDVTDLDKKYQRRATWEDEEEEEQTEVQEITSPYAVDEILYCIQERNGDLIDMNFAGRHWAVNEDEE
jgi:hypothetical protein